MAPIKFEEQLKDKLEERSLQPSADSWEKLANRLDAEEKTRRNPWLGWLSIAAGLIIFLAIAIQVFGSKEAQETTPILVQDEVVEPLKDDKSIETNDGVTTELAAEDIEGDIEENKEAVKEQSQIVNYKSVAKQKSKVKTQLVNNAINENSKTEHLEENNSNQKVLIENNLINKDAVVSAIKEFKSENTAVTDKEVDSLLKLASKELFKDKLQKETSKTVDANSLLLDVEEEMGQSFRSKVFEALKDSYETVKTAVAERNN